MLDLLFPPRCPLCGKIADGVCEECQRRLPYVRQPMCFHCGRPLQNEEEEYCASCRKRESDWTEGRALYTYTGPIRSSLHAVKYQNRREYLDFFARDMAEHLGRDIRRWRPQAIVPVPMHPSAKRRRGYNQAEILAKRLSGELHIPVCAALRKVKKTADQKELDHRARRQNLKGAFAADPKYFCGEDGLIGKRILLVDDVYTTGSTVQEAAGTLARAGAAEIYFAVLCTVPENM